MIRVRSFARFIRHQTRPSGETATVPDYLLVGIVRLGVGLHTETTRGETATVLDAVLVGIVWLGVVSFKLNHIQKQPQERW